MNCEKLILFVLFYLKTLYQLQKQCGIYFHKRIIINGNIVAYFKVLTGYFPGKTEKNCGNLRTATSSVPKVELSSECRSVTIKRVRKSRCIIKCRLVDW